MEDDEAGMQRTAVCVENCINAFYSDEQLCHLIGIWTYGN